MVLVDQNKLEIIINNLLSNAFKFTGEGGSIEVVVTPLSPPSRGETHPQFGRGVKIKISDTGHGIPPEHIDFIFDRFYLVDESNNQNHEGTGIGLALAKELVELHGGEIQVVSELNKGTTFTVLLPVGSANQQMDQHIEVDQKESLAALDEFPEDTIDSLYHSQKPKKKFKVEESDESLSNPVLLIVEDNPDLRAHISFHLSDEYNIIEARNGEEGFNEALKNIPDLIISDVMMPKMDGFKLSKKLKAEELTSHIPVILLTARASKESRIEGLETGADDFITKPFDMDELLVRVKNLIKQRKRLSKVVENKIQRSPNSILIDFEDSGITSMDEQFLKKVILVLKDGYSDPEFNVEEFCRVIGLSRIQLHRKIKALTHQTTGEFIRTYRLNRAAEMLNKAKCHHCRNCL